MGAKGTNFRRFCLENIGLLHTKHPYFCGQTSVLCPQKVRCFHPSGRKPRKKPCILILQYFRPGDVAVTSVALLGSIGTALRGPEMLCGMPVRKIAHSPCQSPCSGRARWSGTTLPSLSPVHLCLRCRPVCAIPCKAHVCHPLPCVSGSRHKHHGAKAKDVGDIRTDF